MSTADPIEYPSPKGEPVVTIQSQNPDGIRLSEQNQFLLVPVGKSDDYDAYKALATAWLTVATFAASITFTIILTPRADTQIPGLVQLAYANSLFCIGIIGSIYIIVAIALSNVISKLKDKPTLPDVISNYYNWRDKSRKPVITTLRLRYLILTELVLSISIPVMSAFVGVILFVAFYLMIRVIALFLQLDGPSTFGLVMYLIIGVFVIYLWILTLVLRVLVFLEPILESRKEPTRNGQAGETGGTERV